MTKAEQIFVDDVLSKIKTLEPETSKRIANYDEIRHYLNGEHWGAGFSPDLPEGNVQSTFNYTELATKIHTAKLLGTNSPGEVIPDCPTRDWKAIALEDEPDFDIANASEEDTKKYQELAEQEAQGREMLLRKVWDDNNMTILLEELSDNAVGKGDGFILGPTWDEDNERIKIENIGNPGNVMVFWSSDEYSEVEAVIIKKRYTSDYIKKTWEAEIKKRGIELSSGSSVSTLNYSNQATVTYVPMIDVFYYIDKETYAVITDKQLLEKTDWSYDFTPFLHFKYLAKDNEPFGKSIIWEGRKSQLDFNETLSNMLTIIKKLSGLKIKGINLPEGYEHSIKGGRVQILPLKQTLNLKQDLEVLNTSVQIWPDDKVLDRVKQSFLEQCYLTEVDLGVPGQETPSGYALEVRSQTSLARAKSGRKQLELTLIRLNANIFKLLEKKVPATKDIIRGDYSSKINFPDVIAKSSTDIVNQLNSRIISLDSAMKAIGIENPMREADKIKSELDDSTLGPELSKNYQLHLMGKQQGMPQPPAEGQPAAAGTPAAQPSAAPAMMASENAPGNAPMPMAQPGVAGGSAMATSPQGMINRQQNLGQ